MNRAYTTKARVSREPDAPLVNIVWYPTELPFIPFPTVFNCKLYADDAANQTGLGEVWRVPKPRPNWNPGIPGLAGDHICGTAEQFMNGQGAPANPPTVYDPDGIPLCCRRWPTGFVTSGVRPASTVELIPPAFYTGRVTSGVRPASTVEVIPRIVVAGRVTSGVRPASTVEVIAPPTAFARVTAGVRPASTVELIPPETVPTRVTAGARPGCAVILLPGDCPLHAEIPAGTSTLDFVPSSGEDWWRVTFIDYALRMRVQVFKDPDAEIRFACFIGADCDSLTLLEPINSKIGCADYIIPDGENFWVCITWNGGNPAYLMVLTYGLCSDV